MLLFFESLNHEPRETICMEKPLEVEWAKSQVITRVELTVTDKYLGAQIWSPLSGSVRIGLRKGTMAPASISVWEKSTRSSTPQLSPGCQTIQFLPESPWYLLSCCPQCWNSAQVSPSTFLHRPFKRNAGNFSSSPSYSATILSGFYSQKLWEFFFPALEP